MEISTAILFLAGLSILLALILAIANSRLKVFEDPRIDEVTEMLPGANCGACGVPGCHAFAETLVAGGNAPSGCTVGSVDMVNLIAGYLGVDPGKAVKRVARLLCAGGTDVALQAGLYSGYPSCRAAAIVSGGPKACTYGCLGLGDCMEVCDFDAIHMSPTNLPVVDEGKCTACNDCVEICPKDLFEIIPADRRLLVQCKSLLEGDAVLELCQVGCNACGRCASDAADNLIVMQNNLPELNESLLHLESKNAIKRCPTKAIVWLEEGQFVEAALSNGDPEKERGFVND